MVRRLFDAFSARGADGMAGVSHPDGTFRSALEALEGGTYRGHGDIQRYIDDIDAIFDEWRLADPEYRPVGSDTAVALYRVVARAKGSGIPIDQPAAMVLTIRGGKIAHSEVHLDQEAALRAASPKD